MTKYTKEALNSALRAEDYKAGDVIAELATIVKISDVRDSYHAGQFKTVGEFAEKDADNFSVYINKMSMSALIDAFGSDDEIDGDELIGQNVSITVVCNDITRNKKAFLVAPYQALSVEDLNNQRKLNGIESEPKPEQAPEPKTEPRTAVKPPAASKPAEPARAAKTTRKPA